MFSKDATRMEYRLLHNLSDGQRAEIEARLERVEVAARDVVIREGDPGDALYLVERGRFEVRKEDHRLAEVGPGGDFGALALMDEKERSATVVAVEPGVLRRLSVEDLRRLSPAGFDGAYVALLKNMIASQNDDLRRSSSVLVESLRARLEEANKRLRMGTFVTFVILMMCVYGFLLRGSIDAISAFGDSEPVTVGLLLFYLASIFLMMWRSGYPLAVYGLTLRRWREHLGEALLWTAGFVAATTLAKWAMVTWMPSWRGEPVFSFHGFHRADAAWLAFVYALFAPSQEFVARGALQSSFHEFLEGRSATVRAIALSSLMFASTHLHLSLGFAVLTLIPSVFWGALYARQRSLLGVSVSHVLIGLWVVFLLGVPGFDI